MRLDVHQLAQNKHTEIVTAVGWNGSNELFSCGDDKSLWKWSMTGEAVQKVSEDLESFATDLHWFPLISKKGAPTGAAPEIFVVACTDGTFRLIGKGGRVEKVVEAHKGAVITVKWSYDGTGLVTGGEDGLVKEWSRAGMLRSTLTQSEHSIYSVCWSPECDKVLFASGKDLCIKPLQPTAKQLQWKAHDGVVLKADWNPVNNLIVSGGEDCKYKVWDCYGRQLYSSKPSEYSITSVAWAPDGELFAMGSFNAIRLCDKTGWAYSRESTKSGSLLNLSWTSDGTHLAGAGGDGAVIFACVVERRLEWNSQTVTLQSSNQIVVQDATNESTEELDFKDRVIKMSIGFGYFVATTTAQCCIYSVNNWNTPHIFDLKDTVNLIIQAEKHFLMIDNARGIVICSYEGRQLSNPRYQGLRTEFLNESSIALCNDFVAAVEKPDTKVVRVFEAATGRPIEKPIRHSLDIQYIALSQHSRPEHKKLALIDRNRDLYVVQVHKPNNLYKLGAMVDTCLWNDVTDMLAAVQDNKICVWTYPDVVYIDKDLLNRTRIIKEGSDFGQSSQLTTFFGKRITLRRTDGALNTFTIPPFPGLLYQFRGADAWHQAVRLCRFVKDEGLWALLAAMSIHAQELNTAEVAYAALEEVDKVQYILHIKEIPTVEGRAAEMLNFMRRPDEAETLLIQASLIYRAIKLNIKLFRWERALELAMNHRTHLDTVLAYRKRHLDSFSMQETNRTYLQYYEQDTPIDWEKIKAKIAQEKEKEKQRPGAGPYLDARS